MATTTTITPDTTAARVEPLHEVLDTDKYNSLVESMDADGWTGRPILVLDTGSGYQALTGSHRAAAAMEAEIEIPIVIIDTEDHISGNDGCEICGSECWVEGLTSAGGGDDERLDWIKIGYEAGQVSDDALALMVAELEG